MEFHDLFWFFIFSTRDRKGHRKYLCMYMCIQYCFNSYLFHIKYQIKVTRELLNFELRQLKCLAKRRTLQLKLSPRTFFKDNVSSSCADNIWRNHIHTYIYIIKYIVISSFSTWPLFGCAFDLFFASIMQANPVSLPPVAPIPPPVAAFQMQMCWNVLNVP